MVDEELVVKSARGMRVAFILSEGTWLGGKNYLRNLFQAIYALPGVPITPVIFTGQRKNSLSEEFPGLEIVRASMLDRMSPLWCARKLAARLISQDILMRKHLQKHNISVLSHASSLGRQERVRVVGWIPDFQHIHLPGFFTRVELGQRNREFTNLSAFCDKVIVSSEAAFRDFVSFAPKYAHKAELLRFVASPVPIRDCPSLLELQDLYNFKGPYFLLPNQFWAHKNHRAVLDALRILKKQAIKFLVLATGATTDYRNPTFFNSLMEYAKECDILDGFRVLGPIPFKHLAGLMVHTTAFINPSRFEGWSTSVEEAKSMGKQIILSNISVHREQAPARSFYFSADCPDTLADAMVAAHSSFDRNEDILKQDHARAEFPKRLLEFGHAYRQILSKVVQS